VALDTAARHAGNFMFNREKQVEHLQGIMGQPPLVLSPYDAELFGHWWFEGPQFLDFLFRKLHYDQATLEAITPMEYLERHPRNQLLTPSFSSWGYKGYAEVWLEGSNDWVYRHLDHATETMQQLARAYPEAEGLRRRALNQAARELLLAQSSDWAFIMKTGTMVPYAVKRTELHVQRLLRLATMLRNGGVDAGELEEMERSDNLLPEIDYRVYAEA
jgi:1,4-alpha-glucan branching enzyme